MRVGFCNGCFDEFHDGHRHFLRAAATQCDYLIVAVNSDASIKRLKGNREFGNERPAFEMIDRVSAVCHFLKRNTDIVFAVIPFEGDEGMLLMAIRPDVQFKGYDHSADPVFYRRIGWKNLAGPAFEGPEIIKISHLPGFSTTQILRDRSET